MKTAEEGQPFADVRDICSSSDKKSFCIRRFLVVPEAVNFPITSIMLPAGWLRIDVARGGTQ
ncbi:UNVERIFIED_CONTAM: hypothetical protein Sangu_3091600 [Sesamum angustifolium]|uniref:Uncharacterized protein n=1 Tax=Sesamum angustifolium TaxID=2727405 RepID=A0AAW2K8Q7_9LAMI